MPGKSEAGGETRSLGREKFQRGLTDLALFLIDQGITSSEFERLAAESFIRAAMTRARMKNGRVNQSAVAVMTGLTRTEVRKTLKRQRASIDEPESFGVHRVVHGWMRDSEFCTRAGRPRVLRLGSRYGEFGVLAKRYSRDIPPKATLDELVRLKVVVLTSGFVRLVPQSAGDRIKTSRFIESAGSQLSSLFALLGPPPAFTARQSQLDEIAIEADDNIELKLVEARAVEAMRVFLNGLESSAKNLIGPRHKRPRSARRLVSVRVAVSTFESTRGNRSNGPKR